MIRNHHHPDTTEFLPKPLAMTEAERKACNKRANEYLASRGHVNTWRKKRKVEK